MMKKLAGLLVVDKHGDKDFKEEVKDRE